VKKFCRSILYVGCASLAWVLAADAQISQTSSVMNGFGVRATGGTFTHISAAAQPGGVAVSYENGSANYNGGMINRAGFLSTFVMFPDLDTNNNGIPDELDPDNDGDGLWDHWEITGEKFDPATPTDPNNPDSSGDGVSDYHAMVAGTDPTDPNATFRILEIDGDSADAQVTWLARGNHERIYVVRVIDDSYDDTPSAVIWSNTVAGGSAPWYATTQTISDPSTDARFFAVEVINP
jgi:hypothetical protein